MKKLRVTVEGKSYDVVVEILDAGTAPAPAGSASVAAPAPTPVASAPISAPAATPAHAHPAASPGDVVCPLSGKVVTIDVKVGQDVEEGAQVATVEAMKMNTYIFAPKSGRVTAVLAKPGDGIEEGTVLLHIG